MHPHVLRRLGLCAAAVTTALTAVVITPLSAQAAVRSSTGEACTIIGTKGNDVLTGTRGRDVMCGRGGNDTINGRGGNDLIDGGPGNDRISGGTGKDRIIGGTGKDRISGGSGSDDLTGGPGNDRLSGGDGSDKVSGQGGDDVVSGNRGNDTLSGGSGGDVVDGGSGFNLCDTPRDGDDEQVRCALDTKKPVIDDVTLVSSTVDVSIAAKTIGVRAHILDDTGVKSVQIGSLATLVSGTTRNGVWETTIRVPRYVTPGPRDIDVHVRDRVGRSTSETRLGAYTIINSVYDKHMPVLTSLNLSSSALDVRQSAKSITATAQITDDLAGATNVYLCPAHAMATGTPSFRQAGSCSSMGKTSGSPASSTWKGELRIAKGAVGGIWNMQVWISDAADNLPTEFWLGPQNFAAVRSLNDSSYKAIPNRGGAFTVTGATSDVSAPSLTSLRLSPAAVDTSTGAKRVTADISGTDVEGISGAALFISGYAGFPNNTSWNDHVDIASVDEFKLISGTAKNGSWRASFVVPGGTPDGKYWIQVVLQDTAHVRSWVSADSGWTYDNSILDEALAPSGTHFTVANSP